MVGVGVGVAVTVVGVGVGVVAAAAAAAAAVILVVVVVVGAVGAVPIAIVMVAVTVATVLTVLRLIPRELTADVRNPDTTRTMKFMGEITFFPLHATNAWVHCSLHRTDRHRNREKVRPDQYRWPYYRGRRCMKLNI